MRLFIPAGIVGLSLAFWCLRSVRLTIDGLQHGPVCRSHQPGDGVLLRRHDERHPADDAGGGLRGGHFRGDSLCQLLSRLRGRRWRRRGGGPGSIKHAWLPCMLSAVTTAAGLVSLYTSELVPIKMFGIYSAAGVLATLVLLFLFLPAWMQLWPMKPHSLLDGEQPKSRGHRSAEPAGGSLAGRARPLSLGVRRAAGGLMVVLRHRADEDQHLDQAHQAVLANAPDHSRLYNGWKRTWARWCRWK